MKTAAVYPTPEAFDLALGLKATKPDDQPTVLRVAITANLVATNAPQLRMIVDDAIADGRIKITLDMTLCADISRHGYGALVSVANKATRAGGSASIVGLHRDLFTLMELADLVKLFRSVEVTP